MSPPEVSPEYPLDSNQEKDRRDQYSDDAIEKVEAAEADERVANAFDGQDGQPSHRTLGRWDTVLILVTNQVGLGILSLPGSLKDLGIIPGLIVILVMGLLSTYTAYVLLQYFRRYPHVLNMMDQARVLGGRPLEIVFGIGMLIKLHLSGAGAGVTLSVAFNTLTKHGMCTVGFIGIGLIICWVLCLPRTFKFVSQMGIPATVSIVVAVFITIITLGVADPQNAPAKFDLGLEVVKKPDFKTAISAFLRITFSYAGNIGFPSVMAEMKDASKDWVPSLIYLQIFSMTLYIITAVSIYCMAGQYTTSPALGAAAELPAKIAYGIALPAIIATGLVFGHTAIKLIYVHTLRFMKSEHEATSKSFKSWAVWVACGTTYWTIAFILGNAIPVFDSILSISSAIFVAWFTFGISACFWFHLNMGQFFANWKKTSLTIFNGLIIVMALFMNSGGLYASIGSLLDTFASEDSAVDSSFSCGDNGIL